VTDFARPFNLTTVEGETYHCVEFPVTGMIVLAHPEQGLISAHRSMETLLEGEDMRGAVVDRPEGS
jgi:hypothetical protein